MKQSYSELKREWHGVTGRVIRKATPGDRAFNKKINYVSPPLAAGSWSYFENLNDIAKSLKEIYWQKVYN